MDLKEFKERYPDIAQLIHDEGVTVGKAEGLAEGEAAGIEKGAAQAQDEALKTGAQAERARIKGIQDLAIPGHEALIEQMKFDGETTPEQAAVKLVQAENAVRQNAADALAADGIKPVAHVATDGSGADEGGDDDKTFEQLVADYMAEHGCSRAKAISATVKAYPEKHQAYVDGANKNRKDGK